MTTIAQVLAGRNSSRVDIPIVGDSVTEGYGASAFTTRYIEQLNTLIRSAYPTTGHGTTGGLGMIPIQDTASMLFTWPVTSTGASGTTLDIGPVRYDAWLSSTASFQFTAPNPTTSVRIMYFNADSTTVPGTFSWQVNSGGVTDVSNSSPSGADGALTASIPMSPGDTLTVSWVSGNVFIGGIVHCNQDESTGVTFHADGHSGWACPNWSATGSGFDWRPAISSVITGAGAFGVFLGLNDWNASVGNETAAAFQSDLEALITYLRGNATLASLPMLLVIPYESNVTYADGGGYPAYVTAIGNAAAADGNAQMVNLGATMAPVASSPGYYYDNIHPNDAGHLLAAQAIAGALQPAAPQAAYSMRMMP